MPRPKGTFKTPEELAAMTEEQRRVYKRNHTNYLRRLAMEKARGARPIRTWQQRKQDEADAKPIVYDAFPESHLREWLRNNCPSQGECRKRGDRWGLRNSDISRFLTGRRALKPDILAKINIDTGITIERLLTDFSLAQLLMQENKEKKDDKSSD